MYLVFNTSLRKERCNMPLWSWFLYLIKGFIPIDGKRVGKIIWLGVWIVFALTIYHKVFFAKQSITKVERVQTQIINECPKENFFVGVKLLGFKLGVSR